MADQSVPQGPGGPRRSEPRGAAAAGEPRPGQPHATDGVPEAIENIAVDRQSRRYAHTLRREASVPVRMPDAASSPGNALDSLDDQFDIQTIARAKPRPSEPVRAAEPPADPANRPSPPSESTALYRKRSNPSLPALSPDIIARPALAASEPAPDAFTALMREHDEVAVDDGVSRLPVVMLDAAGSSAVASSLGLRRAPLGLVIAIVVVALIVVVLWLV